MGGRCSCLSHGSQHAMTASSISFSIHRKSIKENSKQEKCTSGIEEHYEQSKTHWSEVVQFKIDVEEVAEVSNAEVFRTLQMHPKWGGFFKTFGKDGVGELVIGKKFAERGQAELYEAKIEWNDLQLNQEFCLKHPHEWALKVFKKGTFLRHLQSHWPLGMLQFHTEKQELSAYNMPQESRGACEVYCGTLLEDGRFAFLMVKEDENLRHYIDRLMVTTPKDCGPFSKEHAEVIMYKVALGMDWLHNHNIVHRNLKASNVLMYYCRNVWHCSIDGFECSIGVVGSGFFRAPEILQACKDRNVSTRPELFTKQTDVYSYGMTCYEILTGKLPFQGHEVYDYDHVLQGQRPEVPKYADYYIHDLLRRCWQSNPQARPSFGEILEIFLANSSKCRNFITAS